VAADRAALGLEVLVTGGTGELGRAVVDALRSAGHTPRPMSRRPGRGQVVADLATGSGIAPAVRDCDAVVHAASDPQGDPQTVDVDGTARLVRACREAGVTHLLYVSIVGVDRNPLAYYQAKLAAERVVARSGLPYSILRSSQFHSLIGMIAREFRRGPVCLAPTGMAAEPVAVEDVAAAIVRRLEAGPSGAIEEYAGPERLSARRCARLWLGARHHHALVVPVVIPGRVARAFRCKSNLAALDAERGTVTFADWLSQHPGDRSR